MTDRTVRTIIKIFYCNIFAANLVMALMLVAAVVGAVYFHVSGNLQASRLCAGVGAALAPALLLGTFLCAQARRRLARPVDSGPDPEAPYAHVGDDGRLYRGLQDGAEPLTDPRG